jgi:hypothetical protein
MGAERKRGQPEAEWVTPEKSKTILSLGSQTPGFHAANKILADLILQLRSSHADVGQAISELSAGREYIQAPKVRRDFIDELLIKPLEKLGSTAPSERIRADANEYLKWLQQKLANS